MSLGNKETSPYMDCLWHQKIFERCFICWGMLGLLALMTFTTAGGQIDWQHLINSTLVSGGKFSTWYPIESRVHGWNIYAPEPAPGALWPLPSTAPWQVPGQCKLSRGMAHWAGSCKHDNFYENKMKTWPLWTCFTLPQILYLRPKIKIIQPINTQLPVSFQRNLH